MWRRTCSAGHVDSQLQGEVGEPPSRFPESLSRRNFSLLRGSFSREVRGTLEGGNGTDSTNVERQSDIASVPRTSEYTTSERMRMDGGRERHCSSWASILVPSYQLPGKVGPGCSVSPVRRLLSTFCGLLSPRKRPDPPSMASPRWSLTKGLARAWGPSCGHLPPGYYDRVLSVSNDHCCLVRSALSTDHI